MFNPLCKITGRSCIKNRITEWMWPVSCFHFTLLLWPFYAALEFSVSFSLLFPLKLNCIRFRLADARFIFTCLSRLLSHRILQDIMHLVEKRKLTPVYHILLHLTTINLPWTQTFLLEFLGQQLFFSCFLYHTRWYEISWNQIVSWMLLCI